MGVPEPERAKQLIKEGSKAFALPAGVMGGIITTENDIIRILGITLSNWLLILSAIYSLIQILFYIRRELRNKKESQEANHKESSK